MRKQALIAFIHQTSIYWTLLVCPACAKSVGKKKKKTDFEIAVSKGPDGVVKRWPCTLGFLGAGETQRTEGSWLRAGLPGKPPGRDVVAERNGLGEGRRGAHPWCRQRERTGGNSQTYRTTVISRCLEQKAY